MKVNGLICKGHGVASGLTDNHRYPRGTLYEQLPYFMERDLDLSSYFQGTINLDIAPYICDIGDPKYFFEAIPWSTYIPPENFYFFDVILHFQNKGYKGLIYMPDPTTKVDHIQKKSILELIMPKIYGLAYGMKVCIEVEDKQLKFLK